MTDTRVSDRIVTVPNIVSFVRLAAVPVFWWLLLVEDDVLAASILFAVVATTDWIDGFLARRLGQVSKLGKTLDPVADRLMIISAVLAGLIAEIVPPAIGITLLVREAYMAVITFVLMARGAGTLEVRWLGKLATLLVYSSIGLFYFASIPVLEPITRPLAWIGGVVGLALYWYTAFQYTGDARKRITPLESSQP